MKMPNLRSKLIRLAHSYPELRGDLLPFLAKSAADAVTHVIETTYRDSTGKEKVSKDSWLPKWGKPTKANFEKIVSRGVQDEAGGFRYTPVEAKLVSRGETLFTFKPKTASDREAGRWTIPREGFVPKDNPTLRQPPNLPEGLVIFLWEETNGVPYGVAFAGKANKPLWNYRFRNEAQRQEQINDQIRSYQMQVEAKRKRMEERRNFDHGLKEGDILYSSWGYEQTNIDWYEVTRVIGKQVEVREIAGKTIREGGGSDEVVPMPGKFVGPPMKKTPSGFNGVAGKSVSIRLNSYSSARLWDGKPKHQTSSGFGH